MYQKYIGIIITLHLNIDISFQFVIFFFSLLKYPCSDFETIKYK